MSSIAQHLDPEAEALREELLRVAKQRVEVQEFRSTELADIARGREAAERREDAAVTNCSRRIAEVADQLAQESIDRELHSLDDEEKELSDLNALRMRVAEQDATTARCAAELESKREAASAVSTEYDSVLQSVEAARQGVEGQSAAEKAEDAELAAEQARLLRGVTQATHGATAKLEADWDHHRSTVVAAVRAQWKQRLAAAAGTPDSVRAQLGSVSSTARGLARVTAADMAASAAAAFDDHAAPLCRQLEAETARLGARSARAAAVASRLRATLAEASRARDKPEAARRVRRVLDEAQADAFAVDASDPLTSGAGSGFTGEASEQLAAVRDETLRLWAGVGDTGEREMLELSVLVAATAVAHEPGAGAEARHVEALRRFRDESRDEARRLMTASEASGRGSDAVIFDKDPSAATGALFGR